MTATEIMDEAALLLNDSGKVTFTYVVQAPWLKRAINEYSDELAVNSIPLLTKIAVVVPVIAGTTTIPMPADALLPILLEERALNSSDLFTRMFELNSIPVGLTPDTILKYWAFQGTLLNSVPVLDTPNASSSREVRITYERYLPYVGIDANTDFSTSLTVNSKRFLTSKVAEFISRFVLKDEKRSKELKDESAKSLFRMIQIWVRKKQSKSIRKSRYSGPTVSPFSPSAVPSGSGGNAVVTNPNNILDWTNVKNSPYNAKGDGLNDDTVAIMAAYNAIPLGGTLYFPKGVYIVTGLTFTKSINIRGSGAYSVIRNVGVNKDAIFFNGFGSGYCLAASIKDISICGSAVTRDGLRLAEVHQSVFDNVKVCGTGATGFHLMGCLLDSFIGCSASTNLPNFSGLTIGIMQRGWHLDAQPLGIGDSNGNTFTGCHAEGITTAPGIGFDVFLAFGNAFISCVSEGNTTGLNIGQTVGIEATRNSFVSMYFEANVTNTIGARINNAFIGMYDLVNFINWFGDVTIQSSLNLGNTPSLSGLMNLTNNKFIKSRGVAAGDFSLIGLDVNNAVSIGENTGSVILNGLLGFYSVAPIARQLFATGTGKTVDQLITALQLLGLLRQV